MKSRAQTVIEMTDLFGEFITLEDGFVYYAQEAPHGAMSASDLRVLADELDRRNAEWLKALENDPTLNNETLETP